VNVVLTGDIAYSRCHCLVAIVDRSKDLNDLAREFFNESVLKVRRPAGGTV